MEGERIDTRKTGCKTQNSESHIYLYCFFKGPSYLSPQKGIDGVNTTCVLSHEDLCALISPVPADEYNEEALNHRLQDLEWLTPKVRHHEEMIRYAMDFHPVIPVRFGTIYTSVERVLEILRNGYDEFCSHLDFISGKEEWGIKIYAQEDAGRKTAEASSDVIRQLDEKISSAASAGQAYLLGKKRENLIREQSVNFLGVLSERIFQQLLSQCIHGRKNKLLSKDATGMEGDMILNAALLLDKPDVVAFKREVDALAANYQSDGLYFEISGPWPCYNFTPDFEL